MAVRIIFGFLFILAGCSGTSNSDSSADSGAEREPCPELARVDEMRINVVRSDAKQMRDLEATFHFSGGEEEWKCSNVDLDGILCQAMPHMITIIAPFGEAGDIKSADISDPDGFSFSGDVNFEWSELPVSDRCSNTYRRGEFDATLDR